MPVNTLAHLAAVAPLCGVPKKTYFSLGISDIIQSSLKDYRLDSYNSLGRLSNVGEVRLVVRDPKSL